jgi:hypothetical protein
LNDREKQSSISFRLFYEYEEIRESDESTHRKILVEYITTRTVLVGQASACLLLEFAALAEVKTGQAEACPTY